MHANAREVRMIAVEYNVGRGVEGDPVKRITAYFFPDGRLLCRVDPEAKCEDCGMVHAPGANTLCPR